MGRTKPGQHRGFLGLLEERGWLATMASPDSTYEQWMQVLDDYINSDKINGEYYRWMRNFVGIRWLALHLDTYCDIFQAVDRMPTFSIGTVLRPRDAHLLEGSGITAPPLDRVLGIGICFVLRELVRFKVITTPKAHPYCYVPSSSVIRIMRSLGCDDLDDEERYVQSRKIYDFLHSELGDEKVTFGGGFDLPLIYAAYDEQVRLDVGLPQYL
ncbi:MAG: hypothetical protein GX358_09865 [candidate division WS1 bacterium]|jgi:hypothetical protein|nr:hypothetical protein [candidate division WS1 bacterium]